MPDLKLRLQRIQASLDDPRRADLAAVLLLLVLAVVAIGPGLLPGRTPLPLDILGLFEPWRLEWPAPDNPLLGDPVMEFSARVAVAKAWRGGHPPLWNPAVMSGHPLAGDSITGPFYPLQVLPALILDDQRAYALQIVMQLWLAGTFMLAWLKRLLADRGPFIDADEIAEPALLVPALAGAITWQLALYQQVWLSYPYFLATLMWLPLVAYGWEAYVQRRSRRALAFGALGLGLAILGGQLQFLLYGGLVLGLYGLGRMIGWDASRRFRAVAGGVMIAILGLALGAVSLLPALELAGEAARPAMFAGTLAETGIGISSLFRLLDPQNSGVSGGAKNERAVYVGFLPLLVLLLLPYLNRSRRCIGALALCLVVFAIAAGTPLGQALAFIPVVNQLGLMRWLAVWPLVVGLAVAVGLHAAAKSRLGPDPGPPGGGWLRGRGVLLPWIAFYIGLAVLSPIALSLFLSLTDPTFTPLTLTSVIILLISWMVLVTWIRKPMSPSISVFLIAILALDLLAAGWRYTPSASLDQAFPAITPLDRLVIERLQEPFRIAAVERGAIALGPAVAPSLGLDEIGGYSSVVRQSYRTFINRLASPPDNDVLRSNTNMITVGAVHPVLPQLLNVRYLLSAEGIAPVAAKLASTFRDSQCEHAIVLSPGTVVSRTFVASANFFNHLDVRVLGRESVEVRVLAQPDEGIPLTEIGRAVLRPGNDAKALPAEAPATGGFYQGHGPPPNRTAYFAAQVRSAGRTYRVEIFPNPAVVEPIELRASINGRSVEVDHRTAVCTNEAGLIFDAWAEPPYEVIAAANGLVVQRPLRPPLGRAWWVGRAVTVTSQAAALDMVVADGFDPAATVVIEEAAESSADPSPPAAGPAGRVQSVVDEGPNALRVHVRAPAGGWLVLAEAYAPGWSATVDGRPAEIHRADGGIRAVALPPLVREVMLVYKPMSFRWGAMLSSIAVVLLGMLMTRNERARPVMN